MAYRIATEQGARLRVVDAHGIVRRVLDITDVLTHLEGAETPA